MTCCRREARIDRTGDILAVAVTPRADSCSGGSFSFEFIGTEKWEEAGREEEANDEDAVKAHILHSQELETKPQRKDNLSGSMEKLQQRERRWKKWF